MLLNFHKQQMDFMNQGYAQAYQQTLNAVSAMYQQPVQNFATQQNNMAPQATPFNGMQNVNPVQPNPYMDQSAAMGQQFGAPQQNPYANQFAGQQQISQEQMMQQMMQNPQMQQMLQQMMQQMMPQAQPQMMQQVQPQMMQQNQYVATPAPTQFVAPIQPEQVHKANSVNPTPATESFKDSYRVSTKLHKPCDSCPFAGTCEIKARQNISENCGRTVMLNKQMMANGGKMQANYNYEANQLELLLNGQVVSVIQNETSKENTKLVNYMVTLGEAVDVLVECENERPGVIFTNCVIKILGSAQTDLGVTAPPTEQPVMQTPVMQTQPAGVATMQAEPIVAAPMTVPPMSQSAPVEQDDFEYVSEEEAAYYASMLEDEDEFDLI